MKQLSVPFLETSYQDQKETALFGKWIHYAHISPLIAELPSSTEVMQIGTSENGLPIHSVQFGTGKKKILIWSQMHGNESTGTKALFDLFNYLKANDSSDFTTILKECSLLCIPMLNPDGAYQYTRVNANNVDLNRDAVAKNAKESRLLRELLDAFQPQFCFNLHDQRTIFGVEGTQNPATISFLAPSEEITRKITPGRKATMNVIVAMNTLLQEVIPNHIGRYTDEFYPTATGDTFQQLGHNTILIEAGHYPDDYDREMVRKFNFFALTQGLYHIATASNYKTYKPYFEIPNNQKNCFDIIERNLDTHLDVAYQYEDSVHNNALISTKKVAKKGDLSNYLAHELILLKK